MRRELPSVVLLIDYDNLEIGASFDLPGRPLDLGSLIEVCQRYGSVTIARAYADWGDPNERLAVYESGIEPCFAPIFRAGPNEPGKSLADTVLVADGVDILWRVAPDVLVLVTSDKDILPLARLARLRGTRTVVVGSDRTALPLRRLADEYVTYRDLVHGTGVPVASNQRAGLVPLSRSSGTELRGPRLLAEARATERRAGARPTEARAAEPRLPLAESRVPSAAEPTRAPEETAGRTASESAATTRRRRRRRGGRAPTASEGMALEAQEGAQVEAGVEATLPGEVGAETPTEALREVSEPLAEAAPVAEPGGGFPLQAEDRAPLPVAEPDVEGSDALEEQRELAPPVPNAPRPTFGSFAPLVPNDTLTLEAPRPGPEPRETAAAAVEEPPAVGSLVAEAAGGATVAEAPPGTEAAAEESAASPAPAPRRRRTRTPSRGRREAAPEGGTPNGAAGSEPPA